MNFGLNSQKTTYAFNPFLKQRGAFPNIHLAALLPLLLLWGCGPVRSAPPYPQPSPKTTHSSRTSEPLPSTETCQSPARSEVPISPKPFTSSPPVDSSNQSEPPRSSSVSKPASAYSSHSIAPNLPTNASDNTNDKLVHSNQKRKRAFPTAWITIQPTGSEKYVPPEEREIDLTPHHFPHAEKQILRHKRHSTPEFLFFGPVPRKEDSFSKVSKELPPSRKHSDRYIVLSDQFGDHRIENLSGTYVVFDPSNSRVFSGLISPIQWITPEGIAFVIPLSDLEEMTKKDKISTADFTDSVFRHRLIFKTTCSDGRTKSFHIEYTYSKPKHLHAFLQLPRPSTNAGQISMK